MTLEVGHRPIAVKTDTGADIPCDPKREYAAFDPKPKLQKFRALLCSPGVGLKCPGEYVANVKYKNSPISFRVVVIDADADSLLSRDVALKLGLVMRVESVFGWSQCLANMMISQSSVHR